LAATRRAQPNSLQILNWIFQFQITMSQYWFRSFIIAVLSNRIVKLIGSIVALFIAFVLMMDWIVMPIYTKHGEAVEVPNITSMRYEEAKRLLEAQGFAIVQADERYDEKNPIGYVLEQNPGPHSSVKGGRRITMPKLVDGSVRDAMLLLEKYNLTLGRIDSAYSFKTEKGAVAEQSVPPGADIGTGTVVNITISLGSEPSDAIVPSVAGLTYESARQLIIQAGLVVGQITYKEVESLLPETVIRQSLEANIVVRRGSPIDLELSTLPSSPENN
jgi:beta-lactam-binding protein with PASTA domain